jgi:hypothetical protein
MKIHHILLGGLRECFLPGIPDKDVKSSFLQATCAPGKINALYSTLKDKTVKSN